MKSKVQLILLYGCLAVAACKDKKEEAPGQTMETSATSTSAAPNENKAATAEINWEQIPTLDNIGDFPFVTAPEGIDIYDFPEDNQPKDGITDLYPFKKFEVYNGTGVSAVEGKLAVLFFMEDKSNGFKYDQYIFDRNFKDYFKKIGAKLLYEGKRPDNDAMREKLNENLFSGKRNTTGWADDSPFSVYAFKNNGNKYVVTTQSNSAQGTIFVMELKDFESTVKAYKASDIQKELEAKGKAVLYINFDTDKATLKSDGQLVVAEIDKLLKSDPKLKLSIQGYTDNTGSAEHNKTLSQQRAETVYSNLVAAGIAKDRIAAKGYGADKPLAPNDTEENKAKNRRVELVKM